MSFKNKFLKILRSNNNIYYYWLLMKNYPRRSFEKKYFYDIDCKKNIYKFKNKHLNERCFIIGNGPSLLATDLDKIKNEITFATNKIYEIYDKTDWRPTYYFIQDQGVMKNVKQNLDYVEAKNIFMSSDLKKLNNINSKEYIYFLKDYKNYPTREPDFSDDLCEKVYDGYTVTYSAIQFAVYMGFKEIYLLGVDCSYSVSLNEHGDIIKNDIESNYFNGSSDTVAATIPNLYYNNLAYKKAKDYCDKMDIKIYNATRGGKLEIFERINFDKLIEKWGSKI